MPVYLCNADQVLEIDREYLWKVSDHWEMNGHRDRWRWYITPVGYNGAGGYWMRVRLAWEHSGNTHSSNCQSFSLEQSLEIERAVAEMES